MTCSNCFHWNVCGSASIYNDVSMCKQFIAPGDVLSGSALQVVLADYEKLQKEVGRLEREYSIQKRGIKELEHELNLLRIVKQTLEMASGMAFDF